MKSFSLENIDSIQVYIWMMAFWSLISLGWLVYNYQLLGEYEQALSYGKQDFQKMLELEKQLAKKGLPKEESEGPTEPKLEAAYSFFQRQVQALPSRPKMVAENTIKRRTLEDIEYIEQNYVVKFDGPIDRRNLVRYIFFIQDAKKFLKLKSLEIRRDENSPLYADNWLVEEIVFAFRIAKPE